MTDILGPLPPTDDFDFDVVRIKRKKIYLTASGAPCQYIDILDSDAFITPNNSDETELSSDESVASKSSSKTITVPSTSSDIASIKDEKLHSESSIKSKTSHKSKKLTKRSSPKRKKWSGVEYSESSDSEQEDRRRGKEKSKKKSDPKPVKYEEIEEVEKKPMPGVTSAFNNFHCIVCDIVVNSEVTYETHIRGKKHLKAVQAKAVSEIAIQSLNEPHLPTIPLMTIPTASRKIRKIVLNGESLIQRVADAYNEGPLPGLSDVVEIWPAVDGYKDLAYLCNLCDAQCVPNSIMKHLTGFKHYLRCFELIDPIKYEQYRFSSKKTIETRVRRLLLEYERRNGRGLIRVEKEIDDDLLPSRSSQPGCSSWRDSRDEMPHYTNIPSLDSGNGDVDSEMATSMEYLDTRMNDFFCKACDAHMNNMAMWESHVRGKRHLKNLKKVPGESTSKIKAVQCPNETANLVAILEQEACGEVIVGLDFIKETQGEAGDLYNCFLCGACTSTFDVTDHLLTAKHRTKYLEAMDAKGCSNAIESIKALYDVSKTYKETLIEGECRELVDKYGEGKVVVYRSKNMYNPAYGIRY